MGTSRHTALDCDLLVIGSGAGGLSAAVTAANLDLKVIVAEKDPQYGGTTAWSGGWMWIPRNPLASEAGIHEDIDNMARIAHFRGEKSFGVVRKIAVAPPCLPPNLFERLNLLPEN